MPEPTATVTFTCAVTGCDWSRTADRHDMPAGVLAVTDFDAHEASEHPEGAHMKIETTYA